MSAPLPAGGQPPVQQQPITPNPANANPLPQAILDAMAAHPEIFANLPVPGQVYLGGPVLPGFQNPNLHSLAGYNIPQGGAMGGHAQPAQFPTNPAAQANGPNPPQGQAAAIPPFGINPAFGAPVCGAPFNPHIPSRQMFARGFPQYPQRFPGYQCQAYDGLAVYPLQGAPPSPEPAAPAPAPVAYATPLHEVIEEPHQLPNASNGDPNAVAPATVRTVRIPTEDGMDILHINFRRIMGSVEKAMDRNETWTPTADFTKEHKGSFMNIRKFIHNLYPDAAGLHEGANIRIPTENNMRTLYRNYRQVMHSFYSAKDQTDDKDDTWIPASDYTKAHEVHFH